MDIPVDDTQFFLFKGCTERVYPGIQEGALKVFKRLGIQLVTSEDQTCCSGNFLLFNLSTSAGVTAVCERNYNVVRPLSKYLLTSCNGCFSSMNLGRDFLRRDEGLKAQVEDALGAIGMHIEEEVDVIHMGEFLYSIRDRLRENIVRDLNGLVGVSQYGCHYLNPHREAIFEDPSNPTFIEEMIQVLGGVPVEYEQKLLCCGSGVSQRLVHPDTSLEISHMKLSSIKKQNPDFILTICPYCEYEMDNAQIEIEIEYDEEINIPVFHINELLGLLFGLDPEADLHLSSHKIPVDPVLEKLNPV
ncbi:MAG: heterodisulfide reductase-related iron-sulfur binding cluster [Promethearchaeota archaeon]